MEEERKKKEVNRYVCTNCLRTFLDEVREVGRFCWECGEGLVLIPFHRPEDDEGEDETGSNADTVELHFEPCIRCHNPAGRNETGMCLWCQMGLPNECFFKTFTVKEQKDEGE
jgi:hypothetical protein